MWKWLARRVARHLEPPAPAPRPAAPDLSDALKTLLVDAVKANGEALAVRTRSDTEFLTAMGEIRNRTAAQALGSKGGKERARRAKEKREADPAYCPVCKHDNARSSRAIILWHMRGHSGARPPMVAIEGNANNANKEPARPATDTRNEPDRQLPADKSDTGTDS